MAKYPCIAELKHLIEVDTKTNVNRLFNQVDYKTEYTPYLKAYPK